MNSPDKNILKELISIDRNSATAIYLQIAQHIINAIQRGYLLIGSKLPGSRSLGLLLKNHRNTVTAAYQELEAQGWIEIHPNKGAFIIEKNKFKRKNTPYPTLTSLANYPKLTGFKFVRSNILDQTDQAKSEKIYLTDGSTDIRLSNLKTYASQYGGLMRRKVSLQTLMHQQQTGNIFFKEQLSNYLNLSRGLHIGSNNILITRNSEMSFYLINRALICHGDVVVVAHLSRYVVNKTLLDFGARIMTIPIDENGICVDSLKRILKKQSIRALYLTPHHHYPTTVTLSAERRVETLHLANTYGFIIIEDDYDFEFHYEKSAILPLASADIQGMVIYLGTFGQSLAPAFQTGFIIAPPNFIEELYKHKQIVDPQTDVLMEQTLGEMIQDGEYHRQLKKSLKHYQQRRNDYAQFIRNVFNHEISFQIPRGGLAFWLHFERQVALGKLADLCGQQGLYIPRYLLYQNKDIIAMRFGFGHFEEDEILETLEIMAKSYHKI